MTAPTAPQSDTARLDALGCSDHHCDIRPPGRGGMGTNAGCRCLRGIADPNERVKIREALRIYRAHFVRGA